MVFTYEGVRRVVPLQKTSLGSKQLQVKLAFTSSRLGPTPTLSPNQILREVLDCFPALVLRDLVIDGFFQAFARLSEVQNTHAAGLRAEDILGLDVSAIRSHSLFLIVVRAPLVTHKSPINAFGSVDRVCVAPSVLTLTRGLV
jgi:hypothetical protein